MESSNIWTPEIEKKYKIADVLEIQRIRDAAKQALLIRLHYVLQRDWVPDFENSGMKDAGVLLRIRNETYKEGTGPEWVVTLKQKKKEQSIHFNQELEASSDDPAGLSALEAELDKLFGAKIDLQRVAKLDYDYAKSVGLTKHRMLLEKYRESFRDEYDQIILALDELPQPLGYFAEIEAKEASLFPAWEAKLGLTQTPVVAQDYGDLVKELDGGKRRVLTF
jgi:adenylate cyclase class IV